MTEAREYPRPFGRYVLLRLLGAGGMGEVYAALARQTLGLERLCALKTIRPDLAREKEFRRRFRDEARISVSMSHPNVIGVHEVGCIDDTYFIAMELIEGYDLGRILSRARRHNHRLSVSAALFVAREILAALDYSHQHTDAYGAPLRLIHRDISPSNVMVSFDGRVRLADFGLASSSMKAVRTSASRVWGRPGYVAPERLLGRNPDRRVDIYAVGVLLFELLTGEPLVRATEPATALREAQRRAKLRPSTMRREIPPELDILIQRAVAFDPDERYGAAAAFQDDAQVCLARIDPVYNARRLAQEVMVRLFDEASWRKPLRKTLELARSLVEDERERSRVETFAGTNVLESHTAGELGLRIGGAAGVIDSPQLPRLDTPQLSKLDASEHDSDVSGGSDLHKQETLVFGEPAPSAGRIDTSLLDHRNVGASDDDDHDDDDHDARSNDSESTRMRRLATDTFELIDTGADVLGDETPAESVARDESGHAPDETIVDDFAASHITPEPGAIEASLSQIAREEADEDTLAEDTASERDTSSGQSAFEALLSDSHSS